MPWRAVSSVATAPPSPISSTRRSVMLAVDRPDDTICWSRARSDANSPIRIASFSFVTRAASRVNPSMSRCSVTQPRIVGCSDRDGRRSASFRSSANRGPPLARRSQAIAERIAVRSTNSVPTPPLIGTPAMLSDTCTGAIVALTRVSTAISAGSAPVARAATTTPTVSLTGSSELVADQPPRSVEAARIVFATRR